MHFDDEGHFKATLHGIVVSMPACVDTSIVEEKDFKILVTIDQADGATVLTVHLFIIRVVLGFYVL
jgi:hypothetical protein